MKLDYPNTFDQEMAQVEGRSGLGGDIMIHGGAASVGCLAIGDTAIEELFVLAAGQDTLDIQVVISPVDSRLGPFPVSFPAYDFKLPSWTPKLYEQINIELAREGSFEF